MGNRLAYFVLCVSGIELEINRESLKDEWP